MTPIEKKIQQLRNDDENEFADMVETWRAKALDADKFRQSVTDALEALRSEIYDAMQMAKTSDQWLTILARIGERIHSMPGELGLAPKGKQSNDITL
jgi:cytochrome c-type biogenesis protein CcmH/NrfF